jgi:flagellar basal body-associated protein FliL
MTTIIRNDGTKDSLSVILITLSIIAVFAATAFGVYMFRTFGVSDAPKAETTKIEVTLPVGEENDEAATQN